MAKPFKIQPLAFLPEYFIYYWFREFTAYIHKKKNDAPPVWEQHRDLSLVIGDCIKRWEKIAPLTEIIEKLAIGLLIGEINKRYEAGSEQPWCHSAGLWPLSGGWARTPEAVRHEREMQGGKNWKLDFSERDECEPVLLGLSLAGNLVKPLLSLYGTEWRERGYGLWKVSEDQWSGGHDTTYQERLWLPDVPWRWSLPIFLL